MDHLGLDFVLACFVVWMLVVLCYLRLFNHPRRVAEAQRRAEQREVDGPMASVLDFASERERRADRARFRHATRWSKSA